VGLIRNLAHAADVRTAGAEAVVCDLEAAATAGDVTELVARADAVVIAAGAGPGSGAARRDTVDRAASGADGQCRRAGRGLQVRASLLDGSRAAAAARPRGAVWAAYIAARTAAMDDLRLGTWTGPSCAWAD
jgi:hypothetical protein